MGVVNDSHRGHLLFEPCRLVAESQPPPKLCFLASLSSQALCTAGCLCPGRAGVPVLGLLPRRPSAACDSTLYLALTALPFVFVRQLRLHVVFRVKFRQFLKFRMGDAFTVLYIFFTLSWNLKDLMEGHMAGFLCLLVLFVSGLAAVCSGHGLLVFLCVFPLFSVAIAAHLSLAIYKGKEFALAVSSGAGRPRASGEGLLRFTTARTRSVENTQLSCDCCGGRALARVHRVSRLPPCGQLQRVSGTDHAPAGWRLAGCSPWHWVLSKA